MSTLTSQKRRADRILFALLLSVLVYVLTPTFAQAQTYSGPLVITKGGTYKGNWESRDTEVPAIEVRTSEPVIIEYSNIRGAGYLIKSWGYNCNITVRHSNGYGITPGPYRDYVKSRRFLTVDNFKNVVVEHNYMEHTAGIEIATNYTGNGTTNETIKIRYNKVKNIDGRVHNGQHSLTNFVGLNFKGAIRHAEIAWNQVINEPNNSLVEDNINIYNTKGTSDSPIKIHNNYIQGAYPIPANGSNYSGGGIITDGDGDISIAPAYVEAYENHLVGLGNYSMGMAGGNNLRYHRNRAINAATFADGSKYNMYTSGYWSNDYYKKNTTFNNSVDNNVMGIVAWDWPNNRNDISVQEYASFSNNTALPNPITRQTEADEFTRWNQKLQSNGIVLGPNGSGSGSTTAPAPAPAPTPTPTPTPDAGSSVGTTTPGSGKIVSEIWNNVNIEAPSQIPVANKPNSTKELTSFEAATDAGDNYGQRIRGYVTAPVSGQYTFWIAGDNNAELYLSTSEDPAKKVRIATVNGWTNPREWTKQTNQQSAKITLEAGKRYYIEALHVEVEGGDNLAVGWQLPNGTQERPIPGSRLSTMGSTATAPSPNQAPAVTLTAPKSGTSFAAGTAITLTATATDADGTISKVEFFHGTTKIGESTKSPYTYSWANATAGTYSITAKATDNAGATKTSAAASITVTSGTTTNPTTPAPGTSTGGTGKIVSEIWNNVNIEAPSQIPVANKPNSTKELTSFEAATDAGDNYGQRVRGYVTAPVSGQYTFWIAGDNNAELYLSTSEDPAKKVRIATVNGWTNPREWTKQANQQSAKITLEAGKRYYIEALHVEVEGGDNLAVGWQLPNGTMERPIAGNRLSTMGSTAAPAPTPTPEIATGKIIAEIWNNVNTESPSQIPVANKPNSTKELTSFEAATDAGDNYGQRIRGYVTAPVSGQYTFWIAGDNNAELYLSTSEDPAKKVRIATVNGWTNPREWTKQANQQSAKITLEAGKRYYIEALHVEVEGGDNLAVGWQLPNGTMERPIAGNRLSPMTADMGTLTLASTAKEDTNISFSEVTAYPNPFKTVLTLDMGSENVKLQEVVLMTQAGSVRYKITQPTLVNNKLEMDLSGVNLTSGIYILKYTDSNGTSKSLKVVKE
ncbi:PA14 domain-containing protein [Pontibacter burrus]|uniref:T9SS type A sorting domain-containing protein n=1 Tax=Pontibacter burrus TaxID=2704466 RepID=A0A6B3M0S2_9BACT|nr:PA14 domain-containing protein [Pontibacter burrus]NEM99181.1 T9SS type A sorting domain-containing protein [Pontibacter burrus]